MAKERLISRQQVFRGKIVGLRVDTVVLEKKGKKVQAIREVVEHAPAVVIVPVDEGGNVLLIRQYRHPVGEMLLEAPAGVIEPGESPEQTVHRELLEETGYSAGRLVRLGGFWMTPGFATEFMHAYLALELTRGEPRQEEDEDIQLVPVPIDEVPRLIMQGEVRDSKSVAALLMALYLFQEQLQGALSSQGTRL